MTMNVRQELCAVMVFAVVDKAGSVVMENEEEVCNVNVDREPVHETNDWNKVNSCKQLVLDSKLN